MSSSRVRNLFLTTDTSSAEVGHRKDQQLGSSVSARANRQRWRCPPEKSVGERPSISGFSPDPPQAFQPPFAAGSRAVRCLCTSIGSVEGLCTRLRELSDEYGFLEHHFAPAVENAVASAGDRSMTASGTRGRRESGRKQHARTPASGRSAHSRCWAQVV